MDIPPGILPDWIVWGGWLLLVPALVAAVVRAPWYHLRDAAAANILFGASVVLLLLWLLHAQTPAGTRIHLLGAMQITLMFGWQFAVMVLTLVNAVILLKDPGSLQTLGVNAIASGVLSVAFSHWFHHAVQRWLPRNFFIYIFITAFFGAALSLGISALANTGLLWMSTPDANPQFLSLYLPYFLLMMFPEAFHTGLLMSIIVVYKPTWVCSFDDRLYLRKR